MEEYEEIFDDFWADIICPDGEWNLDQVKRELHDYRILLKDVPRVYYAITEGRISKPNTNPDAVIRIHNELIEKCVNEQVIEVFNQLHRLQVAGYDLEEAVQIIREEFNE